MLFFMVVNPWSQEVKVLKVALALANKPFINFKHQCHRSPHYSHNLAIDIHTSHTVGPQIYTLPIQFGHISSHFLHNWAKYLHIPQTKWVTLLGQRFSHYPHSWATYPHTVPTLGPHISTIFRQLGPVYLQYSIRQLASVNSVDLIVYWEPIYKKKPYNVGVVARTQTYETCKFWIRNKLKVKINTSSRKVNK